MASVGMLYNLNITMEYKESNVSLQNGVFYTMDNEVILSLITLRPNLKINRKYKYYIHIDLPVQCV